MITRSPDDDALVRRSRHRGSRICGLSALKKLSYLNKLMQFALTDRTGRSGYTAMTKGEYDASRKPRNGIVDPTDLT